MHTCRDAYRSETRLVLGVLVGMEAGVLCHTCAQGEPVAWEGRALSSCKGSGTGLDGGTEQKGLLTLRRCLSARCSALMYVLLHHVMGGLEGMQGVWSYFQGGFGALSFAFESSASTHGSSIFKV